MKAGGVGGGEGGWGGGTVGVGGAQWGGEHEAKTMYEDVVKGQTRTLEPDHRNTLNSLGNLAKVLADMGRLDEAKTTYERVIERWTMQLGETL